MRTERIGRRGFEEGAMAVWAVAGFLVLGCGDGAVGPTASAPSEDVAPEVLEEEPAPAPAPTPRSGPPKGGGVVLYDVVPDLGGCPSPPCVSSEWLDEIGSHPGVHYIYPDFAYVQSLPAEGEAATRGVCTGGDVPSGPFDWGYYAQEHGSSRCIAGDDVTAAYSSSGHLVLPFLDINPDVRAALQDCAEAKTCVYPKPGAQLERLADSIAAVINADPNAMGVAFDDEDPPLRQPYATTFFVRVAEQLDDGKHLALWRGANVFLINAGTPTDDSAMLIQLRDLGALVIGSFYDIGPEEQVGTTVAAYGETLRRFLLPGRCDGCAGSIGFLERVIATTQIPFQIGLPASASTNEWSSSEAFNQNTTILPDPPFSSETVSCGYGNPIGSPVCTVYTNPGATQDQYMQQALDGIDALNAPITGVMSTCVPSPYPDGRPVACQPQGAAEFCGTGACAGAPGSYDRASFDDTFLGLFLYALRPGDISQRGCETKWNDGDTGTCWGEFPQFIDGPATPGGPPSPNSVWALYDKWASGQ